MVDGFGALESTRNASLAANRQTVVLVPGITNRYCSPSFETATEPVIGRTFARPRWRPPPAITAKPLRGDEVWSGMRSGGGRDDGPFSSRAPDAARHECCEPGAHSTLHGVVFAILCPGLAVHRAIARRRRA